MPAPIQTLPLGRCPRTVPTFYGIAKDHDGDFVVCRVWRDGDLRVNQSLASEATLRFRDYREAEGAMRTLNDALGVDEFSYLNGEG